MDKATSQQKPVMGVQGLLSNSGTANNHNNNATNNPNPTVPSFHNSSTPVVLTRPPIVITTPSPHVSPASTPKTSKVPVSIVTSVNKSQAPTVSYSTSSSSVYSSGSQANPISTATSVPKPVQSPAPSAPIFGSGVVTTPRSTSTVSGVQTNSNTSVSVPQVSSNPGSTSITTSVVSSQGQGIQQPVTSQQASGIVSSKEISSSPSKPIESVIKQPVIGYAGRGSNKSGFVRLEHPVVGPAVANPSAAIGKESKKEPGQPCYNNKPLINQNNNLQNQNLINQSGIHVSSSVTSSTSPTTTASINSPQLPPSVSGTNPVLSANIPKKPNISATLTSSSGKAEPKMETATRPEESMMDVTKDVNLNSVTATNQNNNEKSVLTNGKSETLIAKSSVSVESNDLSDGSVSVSASNSAMDLPSRPVTAPACVGAQNEKPAVGQDVKALMSMLEQSGLCGPPLPSETQSAPNSRPVTADKKSTFGYTTAAAAGDGPEIRPGTAHKRPSASRPPTAHSAGGDLDPVSEVNGSMAKAKVSPRANISSIDKKDGTPSKSDARGNRISARPPSGARSRPSTGIGNSPSGDKSVNSPNGNAGDASSHKTPGSGGKSTPNSTTTTPVEPKSGRTSTPRAASARLSTAPVKSFDEESKLKQRKSGGGGNTPQDTGLSRPKSAIAASNSTPRSRPSSTLYQHTASSAQKGIHPQSPSATAFGSSVSSSPSTPKTSRASTRPRTSKSNMGDSAANAGGDGKPATLKDQFAAFSRFGDTSSDGKHITLSNCDKWMKQAHVIEPKKITTTDTSICFKKLFKTAKKVSFEDFQHYVEDLAKSKKMEPQTILDKLTNCGAPGLSTATKATNQGVVERLTDTSKYTGSHKERFDASGKGKGIEGRRDVADGSGYVSSFKTKLDLNKSDSKDSKDSPAAAAPVKVVARPAKEASPAK